MKIIICALFSCYTLISNGTILEVGSGKTYFTLKHAAAVANAGDTIMLFTGVYSGDDFISGLHGNAKSWITIRAAEGNEVIYRGGTVAFHISSGSYFRIEGLIFEQQTGNGVNIDNGGTNESTAHHIIFERCHWRGMNAAGNKDELKLSGVDDFTIRQCVFSNGAPGGSLVDLVGCHRGLFEQCLFQAAGSNSIQAKGGSSDILITRNKFINGGQRAINIGGSTGLAFFRPAGANYEAKNIKVFANIFVGSITPVAFVGAVECSVMNNTLYFPERWAVRILQETTASGFLPCSNNIFSHNTIIFRDDRADAINIGPNTDPKTFTFSYNLWYNISVTAFKGAHPAITETKSILNENPQFSDTTSFSITRKSRARQAGDFKSSEPKFDYYGHAFATPRSIGAVEFISQ